MALQSLDIARRSATTTPAPGVRQTTEVAKLIGCNSHHDTQRSA
jgi:formate dehydrogenase iron-sulfur subunit